MIEDDIEAWQYGPVVRRIYNSVPSGSARLTQLAYNQPAKGDDLEADDIALLDDVLAQYGKLPGTYLSSLTHQPGSPWERTWRTYGKNAVIPQDLIESHYRAIIERFQSAQAAGRPFSPTVL